MEQKEIDWGVLSSIIDKHKNRKWSLIPLLQEVQEAFGYIPAPCIETIAEGLNIFSSQVQGVITFYAGFTQEPKGKYVVKVCRGTACHVKGGRSILRFMKKELDLEEGETDSDYRFTLETVACLGACFLAPAMMVNQTYYGKISPNKVANVLAQYKGKEVER
ncbi:MAG: NADH-quinone oxidoreductase subunit NuoE [Thermodesulfobacteriota bacterium]|nr:NADH-quinone oxidoreductase subunit NuoE [Thermodesulfobacteriota bacterium]